MASRTQFKMIIALILMMMVIERTLADRSKADRKDRRVRGQMVRVKKILFTFNENFVTHPQSHSYKIRKYFFKSEIFVELS